MNVRNLEQIQEQDSVPRRSRLGAILLFAGACAAVVTSSAMMIKRKGPAAVSSADPLAALVSSARSATPADRLEGRDVTFPSVLSDSQRTTTALAAVKDERGRLVSRGKPEEPTTPPQPAERLPVVPLPVGALLGETPVTSEPKDRLTALASEALRSGEGQALAPAGMDGGFQLQVASFKDPNDADKLVEELRRRGHRAFRQAAYVSERGLWHRVRVGPFKSRIEAQKYKAEFERTERLSPFLVDPEKVKQAEAMRAARLSAQDKRGSRRPVAPSE